MLDYFRSAKATLFVLRLTSAWQDWRLVRGLKGAEEISKKWRPEFTEHGILLEVQVAAALIRMQAEVELFPSVGVRVPDLRFRLCSIYPEWIYVEASKRGVSEVMETAQRILRKVSEAVRAAMPRRHGKVALLRFLNDEELAELTAWFGTVGEPSERTRLKDYAFFVADPIETPCDSAPNIFDEIAPPKFYCTSLQSGTNGLRKATAGIQVTDDAGKRILYAEAQQLPKDRPGIVILDLATVPGGVKEWATLITQRLQTNLNRRINGVILARDIRTAKEPDPSTRLVKHPNPRTPFPEEILVRLEAELAK